MKTQNGELREQAEHQGLTRFIGTPCAKCGNTERFTANGACVECKRLQDRHRPRNRTRYNQEYQKEYYKKHRGKYIAQNQKQKYITEEPSCRISEEVNKSFIIACYKEKNYVRS